MWRASIGDLSGRFVHIAGLLITGAGLGIREAVALFATGAAVALGVHWWYLPVRAVLRLTRDTRLWRTIWQQSWPLGLILILNTIYFRSDTLLLAWLRTPQEVGLYGVSFRLIENLLFFPAMFGGLLLPKIAGALSHNSPLAQRWLEQGIHIVLVAATGVLAILVPYSQELLVLIAGPAFEEAAPLLRVLLVALASMFIGNIFGFTLVALERQKAMMILYALLVCLNITANLLLIPGYGAQAAAWTTLITELCATVGAAALVYRRLPFRVSPTVVIKVVCLAVMVAALATPLRSLLPPVLGIATLGFLFLGGIWALNIIKKQQIELLVT
jgi:O-antigen/teichoic acid export membrane protein